MNERERENFFIEISDFVFLVMILLKFCLHCQPNFLTELKEQLLARSSRVEDIERLKTEFNDQKREIEEHNEAELESLRR